MITILCYLNQYFIHVARSIIDPGRREPQKRDLRDEHNAGQTGYELCRSSVAIENDGHSRMVAIYTM